MFCLKFASTLFFGNAINFVCMYVCMYISYISEENIFSLVKSSLTSPL